MALLCKLVTVFFLQFKNFNTNVLFVDSPFRTEISGAVLKLQEEGKLVQLKDKWWKASKKCDDAGASSSENAEELGMGNVGGVFVVLLGGCLVAFIVAICEFLWNIKNVAIEERVIFLKFA